MENWFKDWFSSEEYLSVYQHRDDEDATKLLELILKQTNLTRQNSILDAACGAGRHSIYLASKGFNVFGFDLSKTLLSKAKENAKKRSVENNFVCADLRNIYFRKKFDLIINLFTSFGYFENDEENFKFINTAYSLLNENGFYVLDFFNKNYLLANLIAENKKLIDGKIIIEKREIVNNRIIKEIQIKNGLEEKRFIESVRLYSKTEIENEFKKIGFIPVSVFGDYDGTKYDEQYSSRLILFFKK
ncbi:MAG: class I SAM-dependent methyltransferase [Ignavibacteriales bacterium]|nr:class I SAM-dependent methyltransferase [Ignavibacteriales bacterium]